MWMTLGLRICSSLSFNRHARAGGHLRFAMRCTVKTEIPAYAGMTEVTSEIDLKLNDNT
jgi:hypothetical protein